uniref:Secreted protein n=1 Tax=Rhipicephalus appendiculatus TaxID=34631 RepID=A0A131YCY4_RHIAP
MAFLLYLLLRASGARKNIGCTQKTLRAVAYQPRPPTETVREAAAPSQPAWCEPITSDERTTLLPGLPHPALHVSSGARAWTFLHGR